MKIKRIMILLLIILCLMIQTNQVWADILDEDDVISFFRENGYVFTEEEEQAIREEVRRRNEMEMDSSESDLMYSNEILPGKIVYEFFQKYELEDMKEAKEYLKENLDNEELKQNMCAVSLVSTAFESPFYEVDETVDIHDYDTDYWDIEYCYAGNVIDGKPDGMGVLLKSNGEYLEVTYMGEFQDGRWNGIGEKYDGSSYLYIGVFEDGELNGKAAFFENSEDEIKAVYGNYKNDKLIEDNETRKFYARIDESNQQIIWEEKENNIKSDERSIFDVLKRWSKDEK